MCMSFAAYLEVLHFNTVRGWIAIMERDRLTSFSLETPLALSHKTQFSVHDITVHSVLPVAVLPPCNVHLHKDLWLMISYH